MYIRYLFIITILLFNNLVKTEVYLSAIVNTTNLPVTIVYPKGFYFKIKSSKSIMTGNSEEFSSKAKDSNINIVLNPFTITSLDQTEIPSTIRDGVKISNGIQIILANETTTLSVPTARIYNGSWINQVPNYVKAFNSRGKETKLLENKLVINGSYILEIKRSGELNLVESTEQNIEPYINPKKLSPQDFLNKAIINNSEEDIERSIKLGADINKEIDNISPLLKALLLGHKKAVKKLLQYNVNVNIMYKNESIIWYVIKSNDFSLGLDLMNKGAVLSSSDKANIINYILNKTTHPLDEEAILILKMCDYDISSTFNSKDLTLNRWYNLLVKHSMGTSHGESFGCSGLPSTMMVKLFLKYQANPNQVFSLSNGTKWTPILLILENYKCSFASKSGDTKVLFEILRALLDFGADINHAEEMEQKNIETPLSFALKYDENGAIIDFLVQNGASIDQGLDLFLKNGGSINKMLRSPVKYGTFDLLWWAVENNNAKAVKLLLDHGVKDIRKASDKNSPLNLAITKEYNDIVKLLISY